MTPKDARLVIEHTQALAQEMNTEIGFELNHLFGANTDLAEPFELITEADLKTIDDAQKRKLAIKNRQTIIKKGSVEP